MAEFLNKKIKKEEFKEEVHTMSLFLWEVYDKKDLGDRYEITFKREENTPYYDEITALEKKWNKENKINNIPILIGTITAIALLTASLIFKQVNGDSTAIVTYVLLFSGLFLFIVSSVFLLLNIKKNQKIIANFFEKRREYEIEINKIKNGKD